MNKKILIIGSGGREHALGWKFAQSKQVGKIYFAPGNGGTHLLGESIAIDVMDNNGLIKFAKEKQIDLTFVGPEVPLANGVVDAFEKEGLKIFGPSKSGARLESDKAFAANFMERHNIPHPRSYKITDSQIAIQAYTTGTPSLNLDQPLVSTATVIKASGLAAGKGVVLPGTTEQALGTIDEIMNKKIFGEAGSTVVIQERIEGPEVSIIAFTDGKTVAPLSPSQDHKRVFDQDQGPNTGGMGAYAPAPFVSKQDMEFIQKEILEKTLEGLQKR